MSHTAPETKTVFVTGARGGVGEATIKSLAKNFPSIKIVAGVRDEKKASESLGGIANVTLKQCNGEDVKGMTSCMTGCEVVVIVPPSTENRADISKIYIDAAKAAGVHFLVVLSVTSVDTTTILFGRQIRQIELHAKTCGIPYSFVRAPYFMENLYMAAGSVKSQGAFYFPVKGDTLFSHISRVDIGHCIANIVAHPSKHRNTHYHVLGEYTTANKVAETLTRLLSKEVKFVSVPGDAAISAMVGMGLPKWQCEGIVEMWALFDAKWHLFDSDVEKLMGHHHTTTEQFLTSIIGAFK